MMRRIVSSVVIVVALGAAFPRVTADAAVALQSGTVRWSYFRNQLNQGMSCPDWRGTFVGGLFIRGVHFVGRFTATHSHGGYLRCTSAAPSEYRLAGTDLRGNRFVARCPDPSYGFDAPNLTACRGSITRPGEELRPFGRIEIRYQITPCGPICVDSGLFQSDEEYFGTYQQTS